MVELGRKAAFFVQLILVLPALSSAATKKALVLAAYSEDTSWTQQITDNSVEVYVYQSKDAKRPNFVPNSGMEAPKYLKFILDHYDDLPDHTLFLHAHENARHNFLCTDLCPYADKIPGGCPQMAPAQDITNGWDWDANFRMVPGLVQLSLCDARLYKLNELRQMIGEKPLPQKGCENRWTVSSAQFGASREQLLKHTRKQYQKWYKFSLSNPKTRTRAKSFEYSWNNILSDRVDANMTEWCLPNAVPGIPARTQQTVQETAQGYQQGFQGYPNIPQEQNTGFIPQEQNTGFKWFG